VFRFKNKSAEGHWNRHARTVMKGQNPLPARVCCENETSINGVHYILLTHSLVSYVLSTSVLKKGRQRKGRKEQLAKREIRKNSSMFLVC
jgi:hypothetical protein